MFKDINHTFIYIPGNWEILIYDLKLIRNIQSWHKESKTSWKGAIHRRYGLKQNNLITFMVTIMMNIATVN